MFDPDAYPELVYAAAADRVRNLQQRQAALAVRDADRQHRRRRVLSLLRSMRTATPPGTGPAA